MTPVLVGVSGDTEEAKRKDNLSLMKSPWTAITERGGKKNTWFGPVNLTPVATVIRVELILGVR